MPKKKTEDIYQEVDEYAPPDRIQRALAGLPETGSEIFLYRMHEQGRPKYITKISPEDFDFESIKQTYGGGRFKITVVEDGETTKEFTVEIEGEAIFPTYKGVRSSDGHTWMKSEKKGDLFHDPTEIEIDSGSEFAILVREIRELKNSLITKPKDDLVNQLLTSFLSDSLKPKDTLKETLEIIGALKGIASPPQSSIDSKAIFDIFKQGLDFSEGGGEGSRWIELVERGLPLLEKILSGAKPPRSSGGAPSPAQQPEVKELPSNLNPVVELLRPNIAVAILSASRNTDPGAWIDIIMPQIPEEDKQSVVDWLKGHTWFSDLCSLDQRIAAQSAWWQELQGYLLDALTKPEDEEKGGGHA